MRTKTKERELISRNAPTWENQLWHARKLAEEKGLDALYSPHAATGKICGCGSCFCCAAWMVYRKLYPKRYLYPLKPEYVRRDEPHNAA